MKGGDAMSIITLAAITSALGATAALIGLINNERG